MFKIQNSYNSMTVIWHMSNKCDNIIKTNSYMAIHAPFLVGDVDP